MAQKEIETLHQINEGLKRVGAILHVAVSITRLHDWEEIEHGCPSPERRLVLLEELHKANIPCIGAIRPALPFVPDKEYKELIALLSGYVEGVISGPLYLTRGMKKFMIKKGYEIGDSSFKRPSWLGGVEVEAIDLVDKQQLIKDCIARYGKQYFESAADAVLWSIKNVISKS